MAIIIGCSGSTGSSLLKTILNRHSQIFAGPETCLFAYPSIYQQWAVENVENSKILKKIVTEGWVIRKGMNLLQEEYGWEATDLQEIIHKSPTFPQFVNNFFIKPLQQANKTVWIEKTPVNAYGFRAFLENYPQGKVLQIVRNPYDTIASLMARGMNAYYATGYYVYNTAVATSSYQDPRYYHLKYEDLVAHPLPTLQALFNFLNIPFEASIIQAQHEQRAEPTTMQGWQHHETAAVATTSIGRFQQLSEEEQQLVHTAIASFHIHSNYLQKYHIRFPNCQSLCEVIGYPYLSTISPSKKRKLRLYQFKDRLSRMKHQSWKAIGNYPGFL